MVRRPRHAGSRRPGGRGRPGTARHRPATRCRGRCRLDGPGRPVRRDRWHRPRWARRDRPPRVLSAGPGRGGVDGRGARRGGPAGRRPGGRSAPPGGGAAEVPAAGGVGVDPRPDGLAPARPGRGDRRRGRPRCVHGTVPPRPWPGRRVAVEPPEARFGPSTTRRSPPRWGGVDRRPAGAGAAHVTDVGPPAGGHRPGPGRRGRLGGPPSVERCLRVGVRPGWAGHDHRRGGPGIRFPLPGGRRDARGGSTAAPARGAG